MVTLSIAFEGEDAFSCCVAGLGAVSGGEEGGGIVFDCATHHDFHVGHFAAPVSVMVRVRPGH